MRGRPDDPSNDPALVKEDSMTDAATPETPQHDTNHADSFDHVLVGTGQATAILLSGLPDDVSIAVIEGGHVGGTCVNDGCTPTKTLIASAASAQQVRTAGAYGIQAQEPTIDFAAVMERVHGIRDKGRAGLTKFLENDARVELIRGWARFTGERTLAVGDRVIRGEHVHLNVGARSRIPDLPGLDEVSWLDHTSLLELTEAPEHLVVLGGSYIGLEMAQAYARLGSTVTVLELGPQLIGREDEDIAETARTILEDEGLIIRTGVTTESVEPHADGVCVHTSGGDVIGSHLLLAVGRIPNSDRLDLDRAGIDVDEDGYVVVDDQARTTAHNVWGLGDVNGRGAFTHTAVHDGQVVLDGLTGAEAPRTLAERNTVYAMFVDPPLGRVGLSEKEAVAQGYEVQVASKEMKRIARAREAGRTEGMIKIVVDGATNRFLGVAAFGMHGDEIANLFAVAMNGGIDVDRFRRTVMIHPTVGELLPFILDGLEPSRLDA